MHRLLLLLSVFVLGGCAMRSTANAEHAAAERRAAEAEARFRAKQEAERPTPLSEWETLTLQRSGRDDRGVIHETTTEILRIPRLP